MAATEETTGPEKKGDRREDRPQSRGSNDDRGSKAEPYTFARLIDERFDHVEAAIKWLLRLGVPSIIVYELAKTQDGRQSLINAAKALKDVAATAKDLAKLKIDEVRHFCNAFLGEDVNPALEGVVQKLRDLKDAREAEEEPSLVRRILGMFIPDPLGR